MSKSTKSYPAVSSINLPKQSFNTHQQQVRENSIKKDNWNLFVGDPRYKTNFFLQFLDSSLYTLYENHILAISYYSVRFFIIFICLLDIFMLDKTVVDHSFFSRIFVVALTLCSFYATLRPARVHHIMI